MKPQAFEDSDFKSSIAKVAKNMGLSVTELLLLAKECREEDGVKIIGQGFDDIVKDIVGVKNV